MYLLADNLKTGIHFELIVILHMIFQRDLLSEGHIAYVTLVTSFHAVRPNMLLQ